MRRIIAVLARHKGWSIAGGALLAAIIVGGINSAHKPPAGNTAASAPTTAPAGSPAAQPSPVASTRPPASAPPHASSPAPHTSATPAPDPTCTLPDTQDLLVRYTVPGLPDSAQVLGEVDLGNCTPTLDCLARTSPRGDGYCTEVAWASDNPGYNADATPAPPLKKVIEAIGGGC